MSDKFQLYLKERKGLTTIENESGFVAYKIVDNECFIGEMFIRFDQRSKGLGRKLIEELTSIAVESDCTVMTGNIYMNDPNCTSTVRAAIGVGFEIANANNGAILICKKLKGA